MNLMAKSKGKNDSNGATLGFEAKLWLTADKLRNNMDAAEYKHVVLGLIFLKYISDTFEEHRAKLLDGEGEAPKSALELEVLVRGVFELQRFLDLLHHFIVFEEDPDSGALHKIIAGYHQFHAVNAAVEETVRASGMTETGSVLREGAGTYWSGRQRGGKPGDRRAGVVRHPAMQNPTLVVLTDRNDLDDQLFGQFQRCADILGQTPVKAAGREHLWELLNRASGGVVFTTIHKFMPEKGEAMPELSARQNIVVIADEAHRSQYGFGGKVNGKTGEMSYGFASNLRDALPNASFIGFTGTPIEKTDANTRAAGEMTNDEFGISNGLNFGLLHSHFPRRWWAIRNASRCVPTGPAPRTMMM